MTIQSKTNVLEIKVFNFVIPGHHCFGQDFSFNMQIITLYHIPALIIKPKQVKYNKKPHFLILNIDFIFRASFQDN